MNVALDTKIRAGSAAHRRATFPVFGGISGSTSTTWSGGISGAARRRGVDVDVRGMPALGLRGLR